MADGQETRDDERWLVVNGRRWRRTDPDLPEALAARLQRARAALTELEADVDG